jgi:AraC-like DNA-binding protein
MGITVLTDINESHAATGYTGRTDLPAFHVFTVEETYPSTRQVMPPYRLDFYQVVLLENSADATLSINTEAVDGLSDTLSFASLEHVLAWVRGAAQRGFIVYFKPEFLIHQVIAEEFPFFRLTEINLLSVNSSDKATLRDHFSRLLLMFRSDHPYRVPMLQSLLLMLLFDCKRLYARQEQTIRQTPAKHALVYRFQQFINQHFLTHKTVESYADLLSVSPDYLNQTVKSATGKTAHHHISERIVLEAKKLLTYSDLNIAEIADYLGYSEPTHFGRFFRRTLGVSPVAWRQTQR